MGVCYVGMVWLCLFVWTQQRYRCMSHNNTCCSHHCVVTVILFAMQPMKLGEHLNSLLLNMCDDVTLSRMSLRTVLDICSKHIRNSSGDPPFSYIRKLVRLVLGSLSQVHTLFS